MGLDGKGRAALDRLLVGRHDTSSLRHETELIMYQPVLYRILKPLWTAKTLPDTVIEAAKVLVTLNDNVRSMNLCIRTLTN